MKLSVIIPCFNEEKTIIEIINIVKKQINENDEIIVIDDYSSDNSRKLLQENLNGKVDRLILNEKNFGKGYSIRRGIEEASGEIVLIQDADLEYDPSDYNKLLKPITDGVADVVYGSRFVGSEEKRVIYFWHMIGNKLLTLLSNMLTNLNLTDMEVCYKAFRSDVIKNINLKENRFGFEPEITAKIAKKKLRIFEVGVKYYGRTYDQGKKIGWKDGVRAIYCILRYNIF